MPEEVRDAVFGNVGTIVSFQVGFDDAEYLSGQYGEEVLPPDLVSLSKFTAYSRLLIDGMPSKTFSFNTLPPPAIEIEEGRREKVIKLARERYAKKREIVEDKIKRWHEKEDEKELEKGDVKAEIGKREGGKIKKIEEGNIKKELAAPKNVTKDNLKEVQAKKSSGKLNLKQNIKD
jgi:hypothetical protein